MVELLETRPSDSEGYVEVECIVHQFVEQQFLIEDVEVEPVSYAETGVAADPVQGDGELIKQRNQLAAQEYVYLDHMR